MSNAPLASFDLAGDHSIPMANPTSPRRNRIDPWGDLYAVTPRGMFTGNRGCVVDANEQVVRHHGSSLWLICRTEFRGWRWPLARPNRWTPLFFLDDAVALAAGHRPCATCRRADYVAYRDAVTSSSFESGKVASPVPLRAWQLNDLLNSERLRRGRGLNRAHDRILWSAPLADLPDGTVVINSERMAHLVTDDRLLPFTFAGWGPAVLRPSGTATVLTPPTSVEALRNGYIPALHSTAKAIG